MIVKVYELTLILTTDPNEYESNRFYSIFDDGAFATVVGVPQIYFYREAASLEEAIDSALVNVRKAGFDVVRLEIEPIIGTDTDEGAGTLDNERRSSLEISSLSLCR